jgi:hypothetical protein
MPLLRHTKLPPPPELGEKTFWDYFPKRSASRIFFMLLALAAVLYLRSSGGGSFGGLFGSPTSAPPAGRGADDSTFYRMQVKPAPNAATPPRSAP